MDHLYVAAAHIEEAILQVNNVIQGFAPAKGGAADNLAELRLIVVALADIRQALTDHPGHLPPTLPEGR